MRRSAHYSPMRKIGHSASSLLRQPPEKGGPDGDSPFSTPDATYRRVCVTIGMSGVPLESLDSGCASLGRIADRRRGHLARNGSLLPNLPGRSNGLPHTTSRTRVRAGRGKPNRGSASVHRSVAPPLAHRSWHGHCRYRPRCPGLMGQRGTRPKSPGR